MDELVDVGTFEIQQWDTRARILQAQGMVSVQARCSMVESFILMEHRAQAAHSTMHEVAGAVLDRTIRFD